MENELGTRTVKVKRDKLFSVKDMQDNTQRLEAENTRLREALERIADVKLDSRKKIIARVALEVK